MSGLADRDSALQRTPAYVAARHLELEARSEADAGFRLIEEGRAKLELARRHRLAAREMRDTVFAEASHVGR
ncbi:hypothetical protein [Ancylobacter sp.]|uniref:hypothetical protein n=1 Tax=Ancylobacter sp. TaxID=1872567 RepID=UPI003D0EE9E6